jgi:hypothetical protein
MTTADPNALLKAVYYPFSRCLEVAPAAAGKAAGTAGEIAALSSMHADRVRAQAISADVRRAGSERLVLAGPAIADARMVR